MTSINKLKVNTKEFDNYIRLLQKYKLIKKLLYIFKKKNNPGILIKFKIVSSKKFKHSQKFQNLSNIVKTHIIVKISTKFNDQNLHFQQVSVVLNISNLTGLGA